MPTIVTSSIGSGGGRDYSTLQAWEDAAPANLVTDDKIWKGECYNDSEFYSASATLLTISGITTDSTRYVWLTTASGQSFVDHANKLTNALYYDQTKGVGIRVHNNGYTQPTPINIAVQHTRLSKLQIKASETGNGAPGCVTSSVSNNFMDRCIVQSANSAVNYPTVGGTGWTVTNSLLISHLTAIFLGSSSVQVADVRNCTLVATGGSSRSAWLSYGATIKYTNTAVFNFATIFDGVSAGGLSASSNYNATNLTAPTNWGANSLASLTFADQFVNTSTDFRAKTGADTTAAGTPDASYTGGVDIVGQTRSTVAPTIGAWELVPVVVTSSIGSGGRDYSTLQAWEDAAPASLVEDNKIWKGECYNDSEFVSGSTQLSFSGVTVNPDRYFHLTAAAGQSFVDHADKLTNPLRYDAAKGVGIRSTAGYTAPITITSKYVRLERLQVISTAGGSFSPALRSFLGAGKAKIDNCILEGSSTSTSHGGCSLNQASPTISNTLITNRSGAGSAILFANRAELYNVTLASPSNNSCANGIRWDYAASPIVKNCAVFGATNAIGGTPSGSPVYENNMTSSSSPPTGFTVVAYDTTTGSGFENITNATRDFRVKSTSAFANAGTRDQTNTNDLDIVGQSRSITTPTIGAWEIIAGGGGPTTYYQAIAGSLTASGLLTKKTTHTFTGMIMPSADTAKLITAPDFSGSITPSGLLTYRFVIKQVLAGSLSPAGLIAKFPKKTVSGSMTPTGAITKKTTKTVTGSVTILGSIKKMVQRILSGALTPTGTTSDRYITSKSVSGSVTPSGTANGVYSEAPNPDTMGRNIIKHLYRLVGK